MKNLLHRCIFPVLLLGVSSSLSANPALWQDQKMIDLSDKNIKQQRSIIETENLFASSELIKYRLLTLSENDFLELLESSGDIQRLERAEARTSQAVEDELAMEISFPRPAGGFIKVKVVKDPLLSDEIAAENPDIHTYSIIPETGVTTGGSVTFTSLGVNAAIEIINGEMIYIEAKGAGQSRQYISYSRKDNSKLFRKVKEKFQCKMKNKSTNGANSIVKNLTNRLIGLNGFSIGLEKKDQINNIQARPIGHRPMRTYRLAVAATMEFTQHWGGNNIKNNKTRALASIVNILTQVRRIYRRDLSVDLQLVSGTHTIYSPFNAQWKPLKDPYTNNNTTAMMPQNRTVLNNILGTKAYDIGHVFAYDVSAGSSGEVITLGTACTEWSKAQGATIMGAGTLTRFAIEYVAHEIGHQLGGAHTYNTTSGGSCAAQRTWGSTVEPGAGITIMSYANTCDITQDLTNEFGRGIPVRSMFHGHSIVQIHNYTHQGRGRCGTAKWTGNRSPLVYLNRSSYTIPARTPFILEPKKVVDADGNGMTYSWEQVDNRGSASNKNIDKGNNPLIITNDPTYVRERVIPKLSVLIRKNTDRDGKKKLVDGEVLPFRTRNMTFRLTARDNRGGVNNQDMLVKIYNTGRPFIITAPAGAGLLGSWIANKNYTVKWDVAKTDKYPINCSSVDIAATDTNGKVVGTFANNVANIGIKSIYIPSWMLGRAKNRMRIRIKCSNNIFFALSGADPLNDVAKPK